MPTMDVTDPMTQIYLDTRETSGHVTRQRLIHAQEVGIAYSQVGVQQQSLYSATSAGMITGAVNQQANMTQAQKMAGYFPTVLPIAQTPVATVPHT